MHVHSPGTLWNEFPYVSFKCTSNNTMTPTVHSLVTSTGTIFIPETPSSEPAATLCMKPIQGPGTGHETMIDHGTKA